MLYYNEILNTAYRYLEIDQTNPNNTTDIETMQLFLKNIVYPTLCNYCYRPFHLVYLSGYCNGINTINTIELPADASNQNDYYNGLYIEIIDGLLIGERKKILDYEAITRTITTEPFTVVPDGSCRFAILVNNNESFISDELVFVDNVVIYPPEQSTPINKVISQGFYKMSDTTLQIDTGINQLFNIYRIIHTYGYLSDLYDVASIIVMVLQDFWKRKGKHGLQGINSKTINLEDTIVEANYLKDIFTNSYKIQLSKYVVPYERRVWL